MNDPVHIHDAISPSEVPETASAFLDWLPGPTLFRCRGRDSSRVRAVVGMLHGNEPSGLVAIHQALRSPALLAVDTVFFVGAVEAARTPPRHSQRMLPGRRDLNRCFGLRATDAETRVAAAALRLLTERVPEAALDLHNNTGENPAYGVGLRADDVRLGLTRLFARHYVHTEYRLGSLMEVIDPLCPIVTIEAGKAGDPAADALATRGLATFLSLPQLDALPREPEVQVLHGAVRVELAPNLEVAYAAQTAGANADLVIDANFDRHNFQELVAETRVGWLRPTDVWPVVAIDPSGRDVARELFHVREGKLLTRVSMTPIMITTHPTIARADCLFYAVAPGRP